MKQLILVAALLLTAQVFAQNTSHSTLSKMKTGDTLSISYQSMGCFHSAQSKIVIAQTNGVFVARLYAVSETRDKKGKIILQKEELLKTATLTDQNKKDYSTFEQELDKVKEGNCTTIDNYMVNSKYLHLEKIDGSCGWHGFTTLSRALFGTGV